MATSRVAAFAAGVLTANAVPHAYAATVGVTHLTPLRGRGSSPAVNALWAGLNLATAAALARRGAGAAAPGGGTGGRRSFKSGVVAFSAWSLAAEWITGLQ